MSLLHWVEVDLGVIRVSLYRLTRAGYGDGSYYAYDYDAVGNILTKTVCTGTGCTPAATTYVYDNANRLTSAGGVAYTWDANGNLLNDGVFTYTYDASNRLITTTNGTNITTGFTYNGLSNRVGEIDNGVVTTYTLDLAEGLTQVLAASRGTNTYLYGNGRIAQFTGSSAQYFLPDGLGSVRQLANSTGGVALARGYEPYGSVRSSIGTGTTNYGFTGEWTNSQTGLIDLRAREYSPATGRFVSKDTFAGDYENPLTLNGWGYSVSNPVNHTDPGGTSPILCDPVSSGGDCYWEVQLWPWGWVIHIRVPCPAQNLGQQQNNPTATPTPGPTANPTGEPPSGDTHTIPVYKGLNATNASEFKNFANPNPNEGEPGGYSAYEFLFGYMYHLPFEVTYQGDKVDGKRGTVVGVQLDSGNTYFSAGVAVYSPRLEDTSVGLGHWSIFVIDRVITQDELVNLKNALSRYAKEVFKKVT